MTRYQVILRAMVAGSGRAFGLGAALAVSVLLMGAALLGLSGWFVTATAAAGLAGTGLVFDVFRPSAMIRLLAIGRTATRYGERLLTHDATLRAVAALRVRVLAGQLGAPLDRMLRVHSGQALNRVTADIDALDALPLRVVLPITAAGVALGAGALGLAVLAGPAMAVLVAGGLGLVAVAVLALSARAARRPARRAEQAAQAFRSRLIDLAAARDDLVVHGALPAQRDRVLEADRRRHLAGTALDRIERRAGLALSAGGTMVAAGALALGLWLAGSGALSPARAILGFFVALALVEAIAPVRRAVIELGRIELPARRVAPVLAAPAAQPGRAPAQPRRAPALPHDSSPEVSSSVSTPSVVSLPEASAPVSPAPPAAALSFRAVSFGHPGRRRVVGDLDLAVAPGEWVGLLAPSGGGKSTILHLAAGLLQPVSGSICLNGRPLAGLSEDELRRDVALLPQRSGLVAGTVRDNLALAAPADDAAMRAALRAVALDDALAHRGGLNARLGPRGSGLSGGESRRLALARIILRNPVVALLDEPTEGIDDATAARVLHGFRAALPGCAVLIAAHRPIEHRAVARLVALHMAGAKGTLPTPGPGPQPAPDWAPELAPELAPDWAPAPPPVPSPTAPAPVDS